MKNTMKKIIPFILVAILLLSAMPLAYAEDSTTYEVGDIIQFGSYPQSEVKDETLIAELNKCAPEWDEWTSYGYYSGDGTFGSMVQGDWMRYTDITYNGQKYRGVKFTQYRPYWTWENPRNTYQDDNGFNLNVVYWFEFDSVEWRILDLNSGLIMCDTIIDAQPYSNTIYIKGDGTYSYFNDLAYTNYASDYETSYIRQWLNDNFYNVAFSANEKNEINVKVLNNDGYYTSKGNIGYEKLDSKPTSDAVFLLSYNEAINSSFGFSPNSSDFDIARRTQGSDYAKIQGLHVYPSDYVGNSYWLLRSPGQRTDRCCYVDGGGYSNNLDHFCVYISSYGIRPAMYIDLDALKEENIYNLGEETYSFDNYWDLDSSGHCFGMSVTSSGYHLGMLKRNNADVALYEVVNAGPIRANICHYQGIQGSIRDSAMVAGGSYYKDDTYDIESDWEDVINYVKDHKYDDKGALQIGYRKSGEGGHAINFLRYEVVNGQERIYAYDNNEPERETYFYQDENGNVKQAVYSTFSGSIDCITLRSVTTYLLLVWSKDNVRKYQMLAVYSNNKISVDNATKYMMEGGVQPSEYCVYELPEGTTTVKITPLVDNATFTYMGQEYKFGEIDQDTYAEFTLSTSEEDAPEFEIINAPKNEPTEPSTPSDPTDDCSCNCHAGGVKAFFFKILNFFQKLFGINKVCACGIKH